MKEKIFWRRKSGISCLLAIVMVVGAIPATFSAQVSDYVDPADECMTTGNRANELDMNTEDSALNKGIMKFNSETWVNKI